MRAAGDPQHRACQPAQGTGKPQPDVLCQRNSTGPGQRHLGPGHDSPGSRRRVSHVRPGEGLPSVHAERDDVGAAGRECLADAAA